MQRKKDSSFAIHLTVRRERDEIAERALRDIYRSLLSRPAGEGERETRQTPR